MRARLRVSHIGQRVPDSQAGYQDAEKGPCQTGARVQNLQSDQESHTSRTQGPVRREKGMRRVGVVCVCEGEIAQNNTLAVAASLGTTGNNKIYHVLRALLLLLLLHIWVCEK